MELEEIEKGLRYVANERELNRMNYDEARIKYVDYATELNELEKYWLAQETIYKFNLVNVL